MGGFRATPLVSCDVNHFLCTLNGIQAFRGATLGKLTSITFCCRSHPINDFLETFESAVLTTSIPTTLSKFAFHTSHSWRPNYRSLLPFTRLKVLTIGFVCQASQHGCSSTMIDDDIITELARAMPKLEVLKFGERPCAALTGVTTKGLATLAYYCPRLFRLSIHFQVATFGLSGIPRAAPHNQPTTPRQECALRYLNVGSIYLPEEFALVVAQVLLRIFPCLDHIHYVDQSWKKVAEAFDISKRITDHSSKKH